MFRRFLVENACTRIDKDLCVRLVSHLMEVDLATLSFEQVGAIHGRIHRSVEGYVRFLRIVVPGLLPGVPDRRASPWLPTFAKEPRIALAMACVAPISLALDDLAADHPERASGSNCSGSARRWTARWSSSWPGSTTSGWRNTHPPGARPGREGGRASPGQGDPPPLRDVALRQRQGDQRGVLPPHDHRSAPSTCSSTGNDQLSGRPGRLSRCLFLQVMAPLNEVHRIIDEGHECSLKVADLLDLLDEPVDRSFQPVDPRDPVIDGSVPLFVAEGLRVDYRTSDGRRKRALDGVNIGHPRRRDDRRGGPLRLRQIDLAQGDDAADPPQRGATVMPGRRADRERVARVDRRPDRLRRPEPVRLLRDDQPKTSPTAREDATEEDIRNGRPSDGLHPQ